MTATTLKRLLVLTCALFIALPGFAQDEDEAAPTTPPAATTPSEGDATKTAKPGAPKPKKKRKKKKPLGDGATTEDAAGDGAYGGWMHARQEGNVDKPYKAEIFGAGGYSSVNSKTAVDGGTSDPTSASVLHLRLGYLFIFGSFGVGPDVGFKTGTTLAENAVTTLETKLTEMSFGVSARYYFGAIDKETMLPYVGLGLASTNSTTKSEITSDTQPTQSSSSKSSGMTIRAEGGLYYFLDSNVALAPALVYEMENSENKDAKTKTDSSGFSFLATISTFI